jgi:hypothetical protein
VSRRARVVVLVALGIGGLAVLFAVICLVTAFGADTYSFRPVSGGVLGAGRIVRLLLGLAHLGFLALAMLFAFTIYSRLPRTVPASRQPWGGQQGYGPQPPYPGAQGYGPYGSPGYAAQQPGGGQPGQAYGPPPTGQPGWGVQPDQRWPQPTSEQPGWGHFPVAQQTWGPPPPDQSPWGAPAESPGWGPPSPDQAWGQPPPEPPGWGQPPVPSEWEPQTWGQPTAEQPGWGQPTASGATAFEEAPPEPIETAAPEPAEGRPEEAERADRLGPGPDSGSDRRD